MSYSLSLKQRHRFCLASNTALILLPRSSVRIVTKCGKPLALFTGNPINSVKCADCHLLLNSPSRPFLTVASLMECLLYGYAAVVLLAHLNSQPIYDQCSFD